MVNLNNPFFRGHNIIYHMGALDDLVNRVAYELWPIVATVSFRSLSSSLLKIFLQLKC